MATIPVFLLEKSHGESSLTCYSSWGSKESDMTEHKFLMKKLQVQTNNNNKPVGAERLGVRVVGSPSPRLESLLCQPVMTLGKLHNLSEPQFLCFDLAVIVVQTSQGRLKIKRAHAQERPSTVSQDSVCLRMVIMSIIIEVSSAIPGTQ